MKKNLMLVSIFAHVLMFSADRLPFRALASEDGGAAGGGGAGGGRARSQSEEDMACHLRFETEGGAEYNWHGMSITFDGRHYWDGHDGPYSQDEMIAKVKDHQLYQEQVAAHERGDISKYRALQLQRAERADRANDFMAAADLYRETGRLDKVSALAHRAEAMKKYDDAFLIFESLEDQEALTRVGRIIARKYTKKKRFLDAYNLYVRINDVPEVYTVLVDLAEQFLRDENILFVKQLIDYAIQPNAAYEWYVAHNDRKRLKKLGEVIENFAYLSDASYYETALRLFILIEDENGIARVHRVLDRPFYSKDDGA